MEHRCPSPVVYLQWLSPRLHVNIIDRLEIFWSWRNCVNASSIWICAFDKLINANKNVLQCYAFYLESFEWFYQASVGWDMETWTFGLHPTAHQHESRCDRDISWNSSQISSSLCFEGSGWGQLLPWSYGRSPGSQVGLLSANVGWITWPRVDGWCGSGISLVVCISILCPEFLEDMEILLGLTLKIVQTSNKPVCRPGDLPMWQHRLVK